MIAPKYYESHVTIEPVFEARLEEFKELCMKFNFHVAKLLMQKNREETPSRSSKDSFCTGHSKDFTDLNRRMMGLVSILKNHKFSVYRYKIEAVLIDVRCA
jgi:hypothetical protein